MDELCLRIGWVNLVVVGEPTRIIRDVKDRGTAKSTRDVVQALVALNDRMLERELRGAQPWEEKFIPKSRRTPLSFSW